MIRWEEGAAEWLAYSGELAVGKVHQDAADETGQRWLWEMRAIKRLPGARASGHRTSEIEARRAVDSYWQRWLEATALKPDLERVARTMITGTKKARAPKGD